MKPGSERRTLGHGYNTRLAAKKMAAAAAAAAPVPAAEAAAAAPVPVAAAPVPVAAADAPVRVAAAAASAPDHDAADAAATKDAFRKHLAKSQENTMYSRLDSDVASVLDCYSPDRARAPEISNHIGVCFYNSIVRSLMAVPSIRRQAFNNRLTNEALVKNIMSLISLRERKSIATAQLSETFQSSPLRQKYNIPRPSVSKNVADVLDKEIGKMSGFLRRIDFFDNYPDVSSDVSVRLTSQSNDLDIYGGYVPNRAILMGECLPKGYVVVNNRSPVNFWAFPVPGSTGVYDVENLRRGSTQASHGIWVVANGIETPFQMFETDVQGTALRSNCVRMKVEQRLLVNIEHTPGEAFGVVRILSGPRPAAGAIIARVNGPALRLRVVGHVSPHDPHAVKVVDLYSFKATITQNGDFHVKEGVFPNVGRLIEGRINNSRRIFTVSSVTEAPLWIFQVNETYADGDQVDLIEFTLVNDLRSDRYFQGPIADNVWFRIEAEEFDLPTTTRSGSEEALQLNVGIEHGFMTRLSSNEPIASTRSTVDRVRVLGMDDIFRAFLENEIVSVMSAIQHVTHQAIATLSMKPTSGEIELVRRQSVISFLYTKYTQENYDTKAGGSPSQVLNAYLFHNSSNLKNICYQDILFQTLTDYRELNIHDFVVDNHGELYILVSINVYRTDYQRSGRHVFTIMRYLTTHHMTQLQFAAHQSIQQVYQYCSDEIPCFQYLEQGTMSIPLSRSGRASLSIMFLTMPIDEVSVLYVKVPNVQIRLPQSTTAVSASTVPHRSACEFYRGNFLDSIHVRHISHQVGGERQIFAEFPRIQDTKGIEYESFKAFFITASQSDRFSLEHAAFRTDLGEFHSPEKEIQVLFEKNHSGVVHTVPKTYVQPNQNAQDFIQGQLNSCVLNLNQECQYSTVTTLVDRLFQNPAQRDNQHLNAFIFSILSSLNSIQSFEARARDAGKNISPQLIARRQIAVKLAVRLVEQMSQDITRFDKRLYGFFHVICVGGYALSDTKSFLQKSAMTALIESALPGFLSFNPNDTITFSNTRYLSKNDMTLVSPNYFPKLQVGDLLLSDLKDVGILVVAKTYDNNPDDYTFKRSNSSEFPVRAADLKFRLLRNADYLYEATQIIQPDGIELKDANDDIEQWNEIVQMVLPPTSTSLHGSRERGAAGALMSMQDIFNHAIWSSVNFGYVTVALRELSTAASTRGFIGPYGPQTSHAQRDSTYNSTSSQKDLKASLISIFYAIEPFSKNLNHETRSQYSVSLRDPESFKIFLTEQGLLLDPYNPTRRGSPAKSRAAAASFQISSRRGNKLTSSFSYLRLSNSPPPRQITSRRIQKHGDSFTQQLIDDSEDRNREAEEQERKQDPDDDMRGGFLLF